jgi:hypothetical protein
MKHVTQFLKNGTNGVNRCKYIHLAVPLAVPRRDTNMDLGSILPTGTRVLGTLNG